MRLLPVRANHERRHPAERKFQANRQRHRRSHVRQHLPLRNLPAHPPRYSPRRRNGRGKEVVMSRLEEHIKTTPELSAAEHSNVLSAKSSRIARRDFLKTTATIGGGLWISAYVPELAARPDSNAPASATVFAPNAFLRIAPDDTVTVISNHSEMGQGIYTSLPMLLNEELEADWSKIKVEAAPVDPVYNHTLYGVQMTGGSSTTPSEWERFRKMGAMARIMLVDAAARSKTIHPDRKTGAPLGHSFQSRRHRAVRSGRPAARYAFRSRRAAASVWRQSRKFRRHRSSQNSRSPRRRTNSIRRRHRCGSLLARKTRPRKSKNHLG